MLSTVVIDNGSGAIKAGIAGAEQPSVNFPSFIGRRRYKKVMSGGIDEKFLIGDKAVVHRGVLALNYPIEHGYVGASKDNWADMQKIWEYTFDQLQISQTKDQHPFMITEAPLNPRENRAKTAEIFFESFSAPALYIQVDAILSLYASGQYTGVVLDSGDGVTCAIPIYEGYALPHAVQRSDIAGRDVTKYLQSLLGKCGYNLQTSAELEIVKDIKEKMCYCAVNFEQSLTDAWKQTENPKPYILPDGSEILVKYEKFKAPEVLFDPTIIGAEYDGMHTLLHKAIAMSYTDLRKDFYSNILLSGGSTLFTGVGDRLLAELRKLAPTNTKIKITAPRSRLTSTWVGGSILASLGSFRELVVKRSEWEEKGKRVIYENTGL